jgi:hypothetical protein
VRDGLRFEWGDSVTVLTRSIQFDKHCSADNFVSFAEIGLYLAGKDGNSGFVGEICEVRCGPQDRRREFDSDQQ